MKRVVIVFLLSLFALSPVLQSCGAKPKVQNTVSKQKIKKGSYKKNVVASYYHDKYNGKKTASGVKFSNSKNTAAHKELPFGTKVKVTNIENGKSVIVEINDRGPFTKGREIDLSKKAFMKITDNKNHGLLKVNINIVK